MKYLTRSTVDVLRTYENFPFKKKQGKRIPAPEEGSISRQPVEQNYTLLNENRVVITFLRNRPEVLAGLITKGPFSYINIENINGKICEVYYKNTFYRGDLKDDLKYYKSKCEYDTEIEVPKLEDEPAAVDFILRYNDYTLGLDPFTSMTSKMEHIKIPQDIITKATSKGQTSRNHLRGKKYKKGYDGYAGLLDLSYYNSSSNKHEEWLTRLKEGKEYTDYSEKKALKEPILVVAVFGDKNFYLYGEKEWDDLKWRDDITFEEFKKMAYSVGKKGK